MKYRGHFRAQKSLDFQGLKTIAHRAIQSTLIVTFAHLESVKVELCIFENST
jgi:hypothetical protein